MTNSKFPNRIAGMSFDAGDHSEIQRLSGRHGVSASHVVRSSAGIGLQVYADVGLRSMIEKAARRYSTGAREVYQDATRRGLKRLGSSPAGQRPGQVKQRAAKYPARIAGIAFSKDDHEAIRRISATREVSEAQVVRDCVSIGLAEYQDDHLRQAVEEKVLTQGQRERDVFHQALKLGLDDAVRWLRVRRPLLIIDALGGTHTEIMLRLMEYVHGVMGPLQPARLPHDEAPMDLRDDLLDHAEHVFEMLRFDDEADVDWRDPDWGGTGNELRRLHDVCREDPQDEHDRKLARYLAGRFAKEVELDRVAKEERRLEEEALLELRGRQEAMD